jgi:protein TonB
MSMSLVLAIACHILLILPLSNQHSFTIDNQVRSARQLASITLPIVQQKKTVKPAVEQKIVEKKVENPPIVKREAVVAEPKVAETPKAEEIPFTNNWNTIGTRTPPQYPKRALRLRQEGTVLLSAVLDEAGHIASLQLKHSSNYPLLDQAALDAVAQWSFTPSEINGQIHKVRIDIPVEFKIQSI